MKTKLFLTLTLLMTSFLAYCAEKATDVFTLDHQMSQMCEKKIKENLRFEKGVEKIDVSLKENTITITYNPQKTDTDKLIKAFKKIGFNAFVVGEETIEIKTEKNGTCCEEIEIKECLREESKSCCGQCKNEHQKTEKSIKNLN